MPNPAAWRRGRRLATCKGGVLHNAPIPTTRRRAPSPARAPVTTGSPSAPPPDPRPDGPSPPYLVQLTVYARNDAPMSCQGLFRLAGLIVFGVAARLLLPALLVRTR